MKTVNKIIFYTLITFSLIFSNLIIMKKVVFGTDGTFILDQNTTDIFTDSFNQTYNEYISPEMFVFGIDQIYQDINDKLYDKYGWDVETLTWEDFQVDPTGLPYTALNNRIIGADWEDQIAENAYTWLKAKIPIAKQGLQDAWGYIVGAVDETTGYITDLVDNLVLPFTPAMRDNILDTVEELKTEHLLENMSVTGKVRYNDHFAFPSYYDSGYGETYSIYLNLPQKVIYYVDPTNHRAHFIYPRTGVTMAITGYAVDTSTGHYYTVTGGFSGETNFTIGSLEWADRTFSLSLRGQYGNRSLSGLFINETVGSLDDAKNFISSVINAEKPISYRWGANQRLKELLDSLVGKYVTTNDLTSIIDILDDSYVAPIPQEEEGVISDSLPLLIPDDDVLDDVDDIIDDIIEWNDEIADVVDDIPTDDVIDDPIPTPDPEPTPIVPDTPIDLPEWIVPTVLPDIFDFKGLNIFKPIFDIVGQSYSMYNTWLLIPEICLVVLILYIIISVL